MILRPGDRTELAEALGQASAAGRAVAPVGGGTDSGRGPAGRRIDARLQTTALDALVDHVPRDLTVTVEGGMTLEQLAAIAAEQGQFWPQVDPRPRATVGGALAAGASTLSRLRFGPVRDSVLEVVVATGDGRLVRAGGRTVKGVSGYDLPRLMVGSLGSLGVIVEATLKLWPIPAARAWFRADRTGERAVRVGVELRDTLYRPGAIVATEQGLWIELVGHPDDVTAPTGFTVASAPPTPRGSGVLELGVAPGGLAALVARIESRGLPFAAQIGVGSCRVAVADPDDVAYLRAWASAAGGHAVLVEGGDALRDDPWGPTPPGFEIMRRLKRAFDPHTVLNPGLMPGGL